MKAWETILWGIAGIVLARSRAQARAVTIRAAREAGYDVKWTEPVSVLRAPQYDGADVKPMHCWSLEHMRATVKT